MTTTTNFKLPLRNLMRWQPLEPDASTDPTLVLHLKPIGELTYLPFYECPQCFPANLLPEAQLRSVQIETTAKKLGFTIGEPIQMTPGYPVFQYLLNQNWMLMPATRNN